MNFALSIIALTLVVALICFYPLLRSVKAKEDKKRDELNKALYFSRLKEIEQDNQQGLVENVEQLKQELQKTLLEDIPQQETQTLDKNAKNYGKLWFVSGLLGLAIIAGGAYFPLGSWKAEDMMEKTLAKLPYFFERIKEEDTNPMTDAEMQQFSTALRTAHPAWILAFFWGLINLWIHGIGFDIRRAIWQLVFLPFIGYFTTIIAIVQHWFL